MLGWVLWPRLSACALACPSQRQPLPGNARGHLSHRHHLSPPCAPPHGQNGQRGCRPPSRWAHRLPQARAGTRVLLPVSLGEAPGGRDADFGVRLPPATRSLRPGQSPWPAEGPGQGGQGGFKRESSAAWSQLQVFADAAAPGTPSTPWEGRVCRQLRGRQHRPPVLKGQLRLPGWVWAVGTPEPPCPQPWAAHQLPPLRKGIRVPGPRQPPGSRTGHRAGRSALRVLGGGWQQPASASGPGPACLRACLLLSALHSWPRLQPQIPAVLEAGCSPKGTQIRNSPSHLACRGLSPQPSGLTQVASAPRGGGDSGRGGSWTAHPTRGRLRAALSGRRTRGNEVPAHQAPEGRWPLVLGGTETLFGQWGVGGFQCLELFSSRCLSPEPEECQWPQECYLLGGAQDSMKQPSQAKIQPPKSTRPERSSSWKGNVW